MISTIFGRVRQFNSYPTICHLPGDLSRQHLPPIIGSVRQQIAHALTFYEIPKDVNFYLDNLPQEEVLAVLSFPQKQYLSFLVYSLKQMVAAGTVSADTAWSLFYGDWRQIDRVTEENFGSRREKFFKTTWQNLTWELGREVMAGVRQQYCDDGAEGVDWLKFEFIARAGKAGLEQSARYNQWGKDLEFGSPLSEAQKTEYRRALWLEMRLVEDNVGVKALNDSDIKGFRLGEGDYNCSSISGHIDLWGSNLGKQEYAFDASLKAEIGHWMFGWNPDHVPLVGNPLSLFLVSSNMWSWELADRNNVCGWTKNVFDCFISGKKLGGDLPPEVMTFIYGGAYLSHRIQYSKTEYFAPNNGESYIRFPVFSRALLGKDIFTNVFSFDQDWEPHAVAECLDAGMRKIFIDKISDRGSQLDGIELYQLYRQATALITLQKSEGKNKEAVISFLAGSSADEIRQVVASYKDRLIKILTRQLNVSGRGTYLRYMAAQVLERLQGKSPELESYFWVDLGKWEKVVGLGSAAIPSLLVTVSERNWGYEYIRNRKEAVIALGEIGDSAVLPSLRAALAVEPNASVQSALKLVILKLEEKL